MAEGHRERVRQRLLNENVDKIPEYVILETMLMGTIKRRDTCALARRLLEAFGSLAAVIDAPLHELVKIDGMGEAAACQLKFLPIFYQRYQSSKWNNVKIFDSIDVAADYLRDKCIGANEEMSFLLCMDSNKKLLGCDLISRGNVNTVDISVRKILASALKYNAARVILAHTHPGGNAVPSNMDVISTNKIARVLLASQIKLDDHIVVAADDYISMRVSPDIPKEW